MMDREIWFRGRRRGPFFQILPVHWKGYVTIAAAAWPGFLIAYAAIHWLPPSYFVWAWLMMLGLSVTMVVIAWPHVDWNPKNSN